MEPGLSRAQIAVYAGLGVVLLLLGIKAMRGERAPASGGDGAAVQIATEPLGSAGPGASRGDLVVHVAGAVREPGVYRLPAGARVQQAIERAGGAKRGADPNAINLAARLGDGQQIVVQRRLPTRGSGGTSAAATAPEGPISLGSATAADLEGIDGIGPITAQKIVDFRDQRGGVGSIEELDEIPGIGPTTLESLAGRLQP